MGSFGGSVAGAGGTLLNPQQWLGAVVVSVLAATLVGLVVGVVRTQRESWRVWLGKCRGVEGGVVKLTGESEPTAALIVAEVSARLRAGAAVAQAWDDTLAAYLPAYEDSGAGEATSGVDQWGVPHGLMRVEVLKTTRASIAAACRLTQDLGIALADVLDAVVEGIEDADAARVERAVARAGPTLTARLLTGLPLLGVLGVSLVGADVFGFVGDGSVGTVSFVAGVGFWVAGMVWIRRLIANADPVGEVDRIVVVELVAAAIEAGASIPRALEAVSAAANLPALQLSARLLQLGASFGEVVRGLSGIELSLVSALRPAWFVGASPEALLRLLAQRERRERTRLARECAQRLAVKLVLPLGLCLLPAFVLLAVVPVVAAIFL